MSIPSVNSTPRRTPKMEIDIISSILEAAITSVDMPLFSPYPCSLSTSNVGTTTAGLTALKQDLWKNPYDFIDKFLKCGILN